MNMNDYLKTLRNKEILQLLADKLITNSDIQRAFFKEEIGDGVYDGKITKDDLKQDVFTKKMINDFVDKIADLVKKALDYEDKIKILTNKNNKLQIDLTNQINRDKEDMLTLANEIEDKEKEIQKLKKENEELKTTISKEQQERKDIANKYREILSETKQNNKPVGVNNPQFKNNQIIITNKQQEGIVKKINGLSKEIEYKSQLFNKNLPPINREELLSKNIKYKPRFRNQIHQNNLPMKNLSKKTKNKNSKINNNDNYIYIEENPYRN